ncbi:hypothetical protein E2C01_069958 [Portunus trituberculatus]|uniref:Uncharacterized protein n=1 Tax=Portunus trituberculatus TaxID=210409 RepID=A0A5B7I3V9_PORTR|nr:hypothetical protein [Portunus trituberculatus]
MNGVPPRASLTGDGVLPLRVLARSVIGQAKVNKRCNWLA